MSKELIVESDGHQEPSAIDALSDRCDGLKAIGDRRLKQITEALDLDPHHFERAHEAARHALNGGHDRILSDQGRRVSEISDPLVRARIVGLMIALADDESQTPNA